MKLIHIADHHQNNETDSHC